MELAAVPAAPAADPRLLSPAQRPVAPAPVHSPGRTAPGGGGLAALWSVPPPTRVRAPGRRAGGRRSRPRLALAEPARAGWFPRLRARADPGRRVGGGE